MSLIKRLSKNVSKMNRLHKAKNLFIDEAMHIRGGDFADDIHNYEHVVKELSDFDENYRDQSRPPLSEYVGQYFKPSGNQDLDTVRKTLRYVYEFAERYIVDMPFDCRLAMSLLYTDTKVYNPNDDMDSYMRDNRAEILRKISENRYRHDDLTLHPYL